MDRRIITAKLAQIRSRSTLRRWMVEGLEGRTAEHIAPDVYAYDGDWTEIPSDSTWPAGKTLFVRGRVFVPESVVLDRLRLRFDHTNLEGLLTINGGPYAGIDVNHTQVIPPSHRSLQFEAEFICVGRSLSEPHLASERARLRQICLAEVDPQVEQIYYDLWFVWEASQHTRDERRRRLLDAALEDALLAIDLTAPQEVFGSEVLVAKTILDEAVGAICPDPEAGAVFLTGHSHIDTAWLWPIRETIRKVGRTFSTACRLLERYPDYHFSCSQPQLYAYARAYYPEIYEEVCHWVREGRWECTGGMWVEPDCNVPSGEALIRQILYGRSFFKEEFGTKPRTCWLPDVFGYPGSLPGILKGCGIDYFMTNKLHWQARNPFPMHLFWWEGIDGSRVLAHIARLQDYYTGWPNPEQIHFAWDNYRQKAEYPEVLFPFGFGDGGGGPTEEMLEFAVRAEGFPGLPACRQGVEESYFDDVVTAAPHLPTWVGELYLETHRGTYTTQGEIKRSNRKNELLLREAELYGVLANLKGTEIDVATLRSAWLDLLLLQFHDILPGSSIGAVYEEAAVDHAGIKATASGVRQAALRALAQEAGPDELVVFNSMSWPRSDLVRAVVPVELVKERDRLALQQSDGTIIPVQELGRDPDEVELLFNPSGVPGVGVAGLKLLAAVDPIESSLRVSTSALENRFFRMELDGKGGISRLFDKRFGREVVPPGCTANDLQLFQDGPEREAAWNVHATFDKRRYAWDDGLTVHVLEKGPVRASVRVVRRYRDSVLAQDVILYDQVPRIDFVTRVDWRARQVMLKAAFPVAIRSPRATYEVQFGAVERATHRNTSWEEEKFEVCAHRWADLSEAGYGVSLLNDCKYGYDVLENVIRLTLLRGAEWPDPLADVGKHEFVYSLLPHTGDWRDGGTVQYAWELNAPMTCAVGAGSGSGEAWNESLLAVRGPAILEALKPAEDGDGVIARLYEPYGGRGAVWVATPADRITVVPCNHVEEAQSDVDVRVEGGGFGFSVTPYQVRSFRLWFE